MPRTRSADVPSSPVFEAMEPRLLLDGTPLITEFLASNGTAWYPDNPDSSWDWVEVHNPTAAPVPMTGWFLTDSPEDPAARWAFPDITLQPGEYRVVFASGGYIDPAHPDDLHASFALDKGGDYVALVGPGGTVSAYDFAEQRDDISYGLANDIAVTPILQAGEPAWTLVPTGDIGTAWTGITYDDSGWIHGPGETTGVGFQAPTASFTVYNYRSSIGVTSLAIADQVINNAGYQLSVHTEATNVINYYNTGGNRGNYAGDSTFPGMVIEAEVDEFVTHAVGTVFIPQAGQYTFGVNSDDGFRLTIPGATGSTSIAYDGLRGPGDTLGTFTFASAGTYDIDLVFFEHGGGSEVELWSAPGEHGAWNGTDFSLVGAASSGGYGALIGTDVESQMHDQNASAYTRIPFYVADPAAYDSLWLRMKYDDGFVAYLNGVKVAERNAPASPAWNSSATADHASTQAMLYEDINITAFLGLLQPEDNVLAIHGLNVSASDPDFLVLPMLADIDQLGMVPRYFTDPTPGWANGEGYVDFVADTTFDHDRGFYTDSFDLVISTLTEGAEIRYTTDGRDPTATYGAVFNPADPVHIGGTTVLRAAAFKEGWIPTNIDTHTYLFLADVITQSLGGERPGGTTAFSATFDGGTEGFTYYDDAFGTSNPSYAQGTYEAGGGYSGGGLRVYLGGTDTNGATSGAWIGTFNLTDPGTWEVSVHYRLRLGRDYESSEYGEAILQVDGTRYGWALNNSLTHAAGDGNWGSDYDSGWQTATFDIALSAGLHTITVGAYNNNASSSREWTEAFFDDILLSNSLWPAPGSLNGQIIDYGMDPDIVNSTTWGPLMEAALTQVPTWSIVTDLDNLFDPGTGIYVNAGQDGRAWERPVSIEYIDPNSGEEFQIGAGIRIRGGFSRTGDNPKHAFRFFFRRDYGDGKLHFDLFPDEQSATEFDNIDLRTTQNYSWAFQQDARNTFLRDIFSRDMQRDMGEPYTRGDYVHLYINGQYWGLFQTQERPEASYAASYFGGNPEDYDVIKVDPYVAAATDGNTLAWNDYYYLLQNGVSSGQISDVAFYYRLQGLNPDGTRNPAYPVHLDVDNLIDYVISTTYVADGDGPISWFGSNNMVNNFYAIRNRNGEQGWQFFRHDAEHSLDTNVDPDRTGPFPCGDQGPSQANPLWFHEQLAWNPEYRLRFADRVQKYFFNDGILTVENAQASAMARAAEMELAIIAESARWGDAKGQGLKTKATWEAAVGTLLSWIASRQDVYLNQLRIYGSERYGGGTRLPLFPSAGAPTFSQHGGEIPQGFALTVTAPGGTIYYTTDGTDPRLQGGGLSPAALTYGPGTPIILSANTHVQARAYVGGTWSALTEANFLLETLPDLRITEVMYNPPAPTPSEVAAGYTDNELFEYLEIQNVGAETVNLAGIRLSNGVEFTFPTWYLAPGDYVLVVKDLGAFGQRYPGLGALVAGEFDTPYSLSNGGEEIDLSTVLGRGIQSFDYGDGWFPHTDGEGFSLVVRDPLQDLELWDSRRGWQGSWLPNGNPGEADPGPRVGSVVINEVLTHQDTDPPGDWIELYNTTGADIDISGWYLSDDLADLMKYRIADDTVIGDGEYLVFTEAANFGEFASDTGRLTWFALSELGETVYLTAVTETGALSGYRDREDFGAADRDVTFGRYVKSAGGTDFVAMVSPTMEGPNAEPIVGQIVINEIMYGPPVGGYEYIELLNITGDTVLLYDPAHDTNTWKFAGGVEFTFPQWASIAPNGYGLVVEIDPATFRSTYGVPAEVPIWQWTAGALNDGGEMVDLARPGAPEMVEVAPGVWQEFVPYIRVEKVTYDNKAPWPTRAEGGGSALNRLVPGDYGNDVANWVASTTGGSPGTANVNVDYTPPSVPTNLAADVVTDSQIDLAWQASADPDTGVAGYRVYRNGTAIADVATPRYSDTAVAPGVLYQYQVSAFNADDVESDVTPLSADARILTVAAVSAGDTWHVAVTFTEAVTAATAINLSHYALIRGAGTAVAVSSAALQPDGRTVVLTLASPMPENTVHALTVSGILGQLGTPIAPCCQKTFRSYGGPSGTVLREWWLGIDGESVGNLTGSPNYPNNPSGSDYRTIFEIPVDAWDAYGVRMRGYVHPTVTGSYTFWIASDDNSQLWLSTDDNPADRQLIAYVSSWTSSREWRKFTSQQSAPVALEAGKRYYIEVLMKEGGGGDNLAVAWTLPGQTPETNGPIPGAYLSPVAQTPDVTVTVEATDPDADEAGSDPGRFTVTRTDTSASLIVYYTLGGTADAGDYAESYTNWVTMAAGVGAVTFDITPNDDSALEGDESVVLTLTASPDYKVATASATVMIADNDDLPVVSVEAVGPAAEQGQDTGTFTFTRTGSLAGALVVSYQVSGTTDGADYEETLSGTIELPDGAGSAQIQITPVDDVADEYDETLVLTITGSSAYMIGTGAATVTILDNELPVITGVELNDNAQRGVGDIEPSGIGVRWLDVMFNETVTFAGSDVVVQEVTFVVIAHDPETGRELWVSR